MPRDLFQLLVWWLALGFVPPLLLRGFALRDGGRAHAKLLAWGTPLLITLIWLHGVLFVPPHDWPRLNESGLLGASFRLHRSHVLEAHLTAVVGLCLVGVAAASVLFVRTALRAREDAMGTAAVGGWQLVVAGALIAHHAPRVIMDRLLIVPSYSVWPPLEREWSSVMSEALVTIALAAAAIVVGLRRARRRREGQARESG